MRVRRDLPAVARYRLTLADGEVLERDYFMGEPFPDALDEVDWLHDRRKEWVHPQDPITFSAVVVPGHEADAREALALSSAGTTGEETT